MAYDYNPGETYPTRAADPEPRRPSVNAARLWAGGAATAVVAAFIGVVGLFIARGMFDIPIWLPDGSSKIVDGDIAGIAVTGAVAALLATALLHVLMLTTPTPRQFFAWIVGLATVIAVLWPFTTGMEMASKLAGGSIALVTGLAIGSLLSSVAASAVQPRYR